MKMNRKGNTEARVTIVYGTDFAGLDIYLSVQKNSNFESETSNHRTHQLYFWFNKTEIKSSEIEWNDTTHILMNKKNVGIRMNKCTKRTI